MSKRRKAHPLMQQLGYTVMRKVRDRLADECGWKCCYCGRTVVVINRDEDLATIEHRIPLSKGGTWKRYNLAIACRRCNSEKDNMTEAQYREVIAAGMAWFCAYEWWGQFDASACTVRI